MHWKFIALAAELRNYEIDRPRSFTTLPAKTISTETFFGYNDGMEA